MATLTTRPDFSATMPYASASGISLLKSITSTKIWNETSLQYYFGDQSSLSLDSEFEQIFHAYFTGKPDSVFAFEGLAKRAFSMIDSVSEIDFSETSNSAEADHVLVSVDNNPNSSIEGFFHFPGWASHDGTGKSDAWSLGAFNSAMANMTASAELGGGQYANWTIIHEIGHGMGLQHTHQEKTGLPALPTVGDAMNNEMYSVMSYNAASSGVRFGHAVSMMGLDVAALQAMYGAESNALGASTYTLLDPKGGALDLTEGDVQIGRAYYCIWDSDGVDEINYQGSTRSVLVNLNDATLNTGAISSDLKALFEQLRAVDLVAFMSKDLRQDIFNPWHHAGGFFSQVLDFKKNTLTAVDGGFSIAHNAKIENAVGGALADFLIGNEQDNLLIGKGGDDSILGSSGSDRLDGGLGFDWLDGGRGNDFLTGSGGRDRFVFASGSGRDEVLDFQDLDKIDLSGLAGVHNFADLKAHHMKNTAGSVTISAGGDHLVIDGQHVADFASGDFIF